MQLFTSLKKSKAKNRSIIWIISSGLIFLSLMGSLPANPAATEDGHSKILNDLKFKPIEFKPTPIRSSTIAGKPIYQLQNDSLPFLQISLHFHGRGMAAERIDQAGMLAMSLHMLENGGAGQKSASEVAGELSDMGARISFNPGVEGWSVSLTALKKDFPAAFAILADSLLKPRLEKNALEVGLQKQRRSIERRNDQPASIASRKLSEIMYAGTRMGYSIQLEDLKKINTESINKHLPFLLSRREMSIALSGDFNGVNVHGSLENLIRALPDTAPAPKQKGNPLATDKIYLFNKPTTQTVITAATFLPPHNNPDYYALQVGNYILGGGSFNSRLMREIRVKRGLAYYAYSYNSWQKHSGRFVAGTATRTPRAAESLRIFLDEIDGMQAGSNARELDLARQSILNGLVFEFDTPEKRVTSEVRFRHHNMPAGYLQSFPKNIRKVKSHDISKVYRKYVQTDKLYIIVVGPAALKDKLEKIRPVVLLNPEDPLPGSRQD